MLVIINAERRMIGQREEIFGINSSSNASECIFFYLSSLRTTNSRSLSFISSPSRFSDQTRWATQLRRRRKNRFLFPPVGASVGRTNCFRLETNNQIGQCENNGFAQDGFTVVHFQFDHGCFIVVSRGGISSSSRSKRARHLENPSVTNHRRFVRTKSVAAAS